MAKKTDQDRILINVGFSDRDDEIFWVEDVSTDEHNNLVLTLDEENEDFVIFHNGVWRSVRNG